MNALSLCSGIGGMDLGLRQAIPDYRTIGYCEIDPACQAVLVNRMEAGWLDRAPLWPDLTSFDARPWRGLVDLVHGGYPCQPFSAAGKQRGASDPRHLWPHVARVVADCAPEYCFFENVANHVNIGFQDVAEDLEGLGYRVTAGLFTALEVGAPHKRQRLYILAHAARDQRRAGVGGTETRIGTDGVRWGGSTSSGGVVVANYEFPAWPPGPQEWDRWAAVLAARPELAPAVESPVCGVADGISVGMDRTVGRRDRLKMLGNAVVPAVAVLAWTTLSKPPRTPLRDVIP